MKHWVAIGGAIAELEGEPERALPEAAATDAVVCICCKVRAFAAASGSFRSVPEKKGHHQCSRHCNHVYS